MRPLQVSHSIRQIATGLLNGRWERTDGKSMTTCLLLIHCIVSVCAYTIYLHYLKKKRRSIRIEKRGLPIFENNQAPLVPLTPPFAVKLLGMVFSIIQRTNNWRNSWEHDVKNDGKQNVYIILMLHWSILKTKTDLESMLPQKAWTNAIFFI